MGKPTETRHGELRGLGGSTRSSEFEGRFGRMFREIPAATWTDDALLKLSGRMTADDEGKSTPETEVDDEENYGLPSGYTYFGQFVDHDITFDPASSLDKQNDPDALVDFRTPRLDLDSLYGRGPDDQPYLYDSGGPLFNLGKVLKAGKPLKPITRDLPRFRGRALIGDKRNDENVIVSQLHGLFLRLHNMLAANMEGASFGDIQQAVRWHYQWLVIFDYLPRIVGEDMVSSILPHLASGRPIREDTPELQLYHWRKSPFMPVEFSGAAYRFGHSMVRPEYRLSAHNFPFHGKPEREGLGGRKQIFAADRRDALNGFAEFDADMGIDFRLLFDGRDRRLSPKNLGPERVQPAYKIDSSLVFPLKALPEFSKAGSTSPLPGAINILALRNLQRGRALGLPSGQAVARFMDLKPIPDDELLVGKANADGLNKKDGNKPIIDVDRAFADNAPLWFYVLAEAQHGWVTRGDKKPDDERNVLPTRLGPVGGRIVAEVLIGLALGDGHSFLSINPAWKPSLGDSKATSVFKRFTMGDLADALPPVKESE